MPCVVWCRDPQKMDAHLRVALAGRPELQVRLASSCFAALAGLLLASESDVRVLVLEEPEELRGVAEVLVRLERHVPQTKVWVYSKSPKPVLRGLVTGDLSRKSDSGMRETPVAAKPVVKMPQVVVVPGIASKVARGGNAGASGSTAAQEWTPRVVGLAPEPRSGPEMQVPDNQPGTGPLQSESTRSLSVGPDPSGSSVGGVRPPSLLTDEELSMLLANESEREHS